MHSFISWMYQWWCGVPISRFQKQHISIVTEWKEFLRTLTSVGDTGIDSYRIQFSRMLERFARSLSLGDQEVFMRRYVPHEMHQRMSGLLLIHRSGFTSNGLGAQDQRLYHETLISTLLDLWTNCHKELFSQMFRRVYDIWILPLYLTGLVTAALLSLWLGLFVLSISLPLPEREEALTLYFELWSYWKGMLILNGMPILIAFSIGFIMRRISYSSLRRTVCEMQTKARDSSVFFEILRGTRKSKRSSVKFLRSFMAQPEIHFVDTQSNPSQ